MRATPTDVRYHLNHFERWFVLQQDHVWFDLSNFSPPLPMRESRFAFLLHRDPPHPTSYRSVIFTSRPRPPPPCYHTSLPTFLPKKCLNNKNMRTISLYLSTAVFLLEMHFHEFYIYFCISPFLSRLTVTVFLHLTSSDTSHQNAQ